MFTYVHGGFYLDYQDVAPQGDCPQSKYIDGANTTAAYDRASTCLWMTPGALEPHHGPARPHEADGLPDGASVLGSEDRWHLLPDEHARRRPLAEVRPRLAA
jgi:hypothetical protein